MNTHEQSDTINASEEDKVTRILFTAEKTNEHKNLDQLFMHDFSIDPLYTQLLEAADQLKQNIEEQTQAKIDLIKHETAEQTKEIYQRLTEARAEFKQVELTLQNKNKEIESLKFSNKELEAQLQEAHIINQTQQEKIKTLTHQLENTDSKKEKEIYLLNTKNDALIERLKNKIDQINQDYRHQLTNLQQKLTYQQNQFVDEISHLSDENETMRTKLIQFKEDQDNLSLLRQENETLKSNATCMQRSLKEKSEKLLRADHSLKLANDELERSQQYIKELEEKNNSVQKELFENWINKKDEL